MFGVYETAFTNDYGFPLRMTIIGYILILIQLTPMIYFFIRYWDETDNYDIYNIELQTALQIKDEAEFEIKENKKF